MQQTKNSKGEKEYNWWAKNVTKNDLSYNPENTYLENKELARKEHNKNIIKSKYYSQLRTLIKKIAQGYGKILFVSGKAGYGKSYNIKDILKETNTDYLEVTGDLTHAYLYRLLFENNNKVIWLKDQISLLKNQETLNLLKSATETSQECVLTKHSYSKYQADLPDEFVCNCRFIFDYNTVPTKTLKEDIDALQSRGDYIEIMFSNKEIIDIMVHLTSNQEEKEVTNYLITKLNNKPYVNINLRTQQKAFSTYKFCKHNNLNWKKEVDNLIKEYSKDRSLLYSIMGKEDIPSDELKKVLIKKGIINSLTSANRYLKKMLFIGELHKVSVGERSFNVNINPR